MIGEIIGHFRILEKLGAGGMGEVHWEQTKVIPTERNCPQCPPVKLLSTLFGKSNLAVEWCPQCHGIWLERNELEAIIQDLQDDLTMRPAEIEKIVVDDLKKVWSGAPEGRLAELRDAHAALHDMINASIFEHPGMMGLLRNIQKNIPANV